MVEINPLPDSNMPGWTPKASASNAASESLGDQAEAFYSWYQSVRQPGFPKEGYHALQSIMNISEQGTASQEEAKTASEKLSILMDDIDGGSKTLDQIPHEMERILDGLTQHNARSRVVMQATQIQININLSELSAPEEFQESMNALISKVSQEMPNIKAELISSALNEAILQPENTKSLQQKIQSLLD